MSSAFAIEVPDSGGFVPSAEEEPTAIEVRAELSRILDSRYFRRSERLRRFLSFVVGEQFAGRGRELSEYAIATEVYNRGSLFDPAIDSIVRVEARRLRLTLAKYYASDGWEDAVWITIPKGGYEPWFRRRQAPAGGTDGLAVLAVLSIKDLRGSPSPESAAISDHALTAVFDLFRSTRP